MSGGSDDLKLQTLDEHGKTPTPTDSAPDSHNEHEELVSKNRDLSLEEAFKYRTAVLVISWISIAVLSVLGIITLVAAILSKSSASYAFSLDALLDCMSSAIVIWRYNVTASLYSGQKEKRACIALGVLFLISAVAVAGKSIAALVQDVVPRETPQQIGDFVRILTVVNGVVCTLLMSAKFYIGVKLHSTSIITDAVNSLIGAVLAFSILFSEMAKEINPSVWYLDGIAGCVCAVALIVYGAWVIKHSLEEDSNSNSPS